MMRERKEGVVLDLDKGDVVSRVNRVSVMDDDTIEFVTNRFLLRASLGIRRRGRVDGEVE
jgi:hypothetical protein